MPVMTFVPMGRPNTYEIYVDGASVGMVWEDGGFWHADALSIARPKIVEADRQEAANRLIASRFLS